MSRFGEIVLGITRFLTRMGNQGVLISILVLALVGFIIIPLPTFVLDILLVFNIVLALVVLLRGLTVDEPVGLFSFPPSGSIRGTRTRHPPRRISHLDWIRCNTWWRTRKADAPTR